TIPEEYKQDLGKRRDVIYQTCMPKNTLGTLMPIDELEEDVKWICCAFPDNKHKQKIKDFIEYVDGRINIHIINQKKWTRWTKWLSDSSAGSSVVTRGIPQTGTAAIFDLLQYSIKEMYVTGMTFFQKRATDRSVYYPGYFPSEKRPNLKYTKHHFRQEFKCFRSLCEKDKRIKCDKILSKLISR
ncbi:unnamed protein product, partial [marine sediment metagenome]